MPNGLHRPELPARPETPERRGGARLQRHASMADLRSLRQQLLFDSQASRENLELAALDLENRSPASVGNELVKRFLAYGVLGWTTEILYTAAHRARDTGVFGDLRGHTYLSMFPIYGLAAPLFEPVHSRMRDLPVTVRWPIYAVGILGIELACGAFLEWLTGSCPWDYTPDVASAWHFHGWIRYDYAVLWGFFGLALERAHNALDQLLQSREP
jgi:hypothetical protein